ncbi:MAG: CBS domain-containing protein [Lewinellaceae bacterium]|nr:CBS domain-containing protein [Lewinellaceae bacterium]
MAKLPYFCLAVRRQHVMAWFFLGFLIYFLALLAERLLVELPADAIEQLRTKQTWWARQAYQLVEQLRTALVALLLARILLKILLTVFLVNLLMHHEPIRTGLYHWSVALGLPGAIIWLPAGGVFVVLLAVVFWGLQKFNRPMLSKGYAAAGLQALVPFVLFWKTIFSPFLPLVATLEKTEAPLAVDDPAVPRVTENMGQTGRQNDIELLKSIVKFSDVTVKQVMQPRSKVVAVDLRTRFSDLLHIVREAEFSRIPVYDGGLDDAIGILYVKDLVQHLGQSDDFEWQPLIRTGLHFVPEAKPASELLREFKQNRQHIAIVVDEYGGCSGIVTLEDILEEITGEIRDEFDEESEIRYRKIDDRNYIFEGQTLLGDVCRLAGIAPGTFEDIRGNAETLAGLVLEIKGDIPGPGTAIRLDGYLLTIVAADKRKIEQMKLTITD